MGNVNTSVFPRLLIYAHYPIIGALSSKMICAIKSLSWIASLPLQMTSVKTILSLLRRTRLYMAWKKEDLDTVMTPEMERKYWKSAAKDRMKLLRSDARFVGTGGRHTGTMPPVILSYTPALPPEKPRKINRYEDYFITPKAYCKWHRMVYPGTKHPTIAEASRLRVTHDPEELRQIHHISRMLPDVQVFPDADGVPKPWSSKYQRKWRKWLKSRENDVIFVDEDLETPHLSHKIQPEIKNFSPRRRSKSRMTDLKHT